MAIKITPLPEDGENQGKRPKRAAKPRKPPSTRPRDVAAQENTTRALQLRIAGATFEEIAGALNLSHRSRAYDAVKRGLRDLKSATLDSAEEYRDLQMERAEKLLRAVWGDAIGRVVGEGQRLPPDLKAQAAALKIMAFQSKLMGIDGGDDPQVVDNGVRGLVILPGMAEDADEWERRAIEIQQELAAPVIDV